MAGPPKDNTPFIPPDDNRVGPYRLIRRIGNGPTPHTFLGERADGVGDPAPACVKRLPVQPGPELDAYLQEGRAIATLQISEIVGLLDFGVAGSDCYIAQQLVEGIDLRALLRARAPLGKSMTVYIALRVAAALEACHRIGILHRDVSPGNILLTPNGEVKLTDLGVVRARGTGSPTRLDMEMGKPQYMAPEYPMGQPVGTAADLYSLGVVMYECLTGVRPYEAMSAAQTAELAAQGRRQHLQALAPTTPGPIIALIDSLLDPNPAARPPDAASVLARLDDAPVRRDMADRLRQLVVEVGARKQVSLRAAPAVVSPTARQRRNSSGKPASQQPTPAPAPTASLLASSKFIWLATGGVLVTLGWLCIQLLK